MTPTMLVRIDKWLWAARFYKTRSLAAEAVDAGHIKVNGLRCKRARPVRAGDRIAIIRGAETIELVVAQLSEIRGPAPVAQALYEESAESVQRRERERAQRLAAGGAMRAPAVRPTKRDRRMLERWRGKGSDAGN